MATDSVAFLRLAKPYSARGLKRELNAIPARHLKKPVAAFMAEIAQNLALSVLVVSIAAAK